MVILVAEWNTASCKVTLLQVTKARRWFQFRRFYKRITHHFYLHSFIKLSQNISSKSLIHVFIAKFPSVVITFKPIQIQ